MVPSTNPVPTPAFVHAQTHTHTHTHARTHACAHSSGSSAKTSTSSAGCADKDSVAWQMQKTCEFALTAAVHSLHKGDLPAHGQNQGPALHPRRILSAQDGSQVTPCAANAPESCGATLPCHSGEQERASFVGMGTEWLRKAETSIAQLIVPRMLRCGPGVQLSCMVKAPRDCISQRLLCPTRVVTGAHSCSLNPDIRTSLPVLQLGP